MATSFTRHGDESIFQQSRQGNVLILVLCPDPAMSTYVSKQHEYNRLFKMLDDETGCHLLLDLHQTQILDSVTIGILVSLTNRCRENGGESVISGVSQEVYEMLGRLMLLQPDNKRAMWQTLETREEAIAFLQK